jgi:hypothetical protein
MLTEEIVVYPNPVHDVVHVSINLRKAQPVQFKLVNASGRTVMVQKNDLKKGANLIEIAQTRNLPKGVYYLVIIQDNTATQHKIVVQR